MGSLALKLTSDGSNPSHGALFQRDHKEPVSAGGVFEPTFSKEKFCVGQCTWLG